MQKTAQELKLQNIELSLKQIGKQLVKTMLTETLNETKSVTRFHSKIFFAQFCAVGFIFGITHQPQLPLLFI